MTSDLTVETEVMIEPGATAELEEPMLAAIAEYVLRHEGAAGRWSVTIVITTDERLRALHRDFMGMDIETDVMTFPAASPPGEDVSGGDVVISGERAAAQAGDFGHTMEEEVRFLAAHGLLHLCGWTDVTPADRESMLDRQRQLIARFNRDTASSAADEGAAEDVGGG